MPFMIRDLMITVLPGMIDPGVFGPCDGGSDIPPGPPPDRSARPCARPAWATATGSPEPANFEAAKNAMSGEVAAALKN